jgi:hypothetical protein
MTQNLYHRQPAPVYPPSLALHQDHRQIVMTRDLALRIAAGESFQFADQEIRAVADERAMLKETGWAMRPMVQR